MLLFGLGAPLADSPMTLIVDPFEELLPELDANNNPAPNAPPIAPATAYPMPPPPPAGPK